MIESVEVIGCGGAFDTEMTNSSFLINTLNESILFDCGYNVFTKLKELEKDRPNIIKDISYVIISHLDDDHVGSLKSFLYYRYFIYGLTTTVIGQEKALKFLDGINKKMESFKFVGANIYKANIIYNELFFNINKLDNISFKSISGIHHIETSGILIRDSEKIILISGDTKSTCNFSNTIEEVSKIMKVPFGSNTLIFHDYSPWNAPSRNVHATDNCMRSEYPEWFRNKMIKYHFSTCNIEGNIYKFNSKEKKWYLENT